MLLRRRTCFSSATAFCYLLFCPILEAQGLNPRLASMQKIMNNTIMVLQ
jgi:hypothetical protein